MNANEYQKLAARTLIDKPGFKITDDDWRLIWGAIRLCAFAGAIAENVKKGVFHQHGVNMAQLRSDLVNMQAVAANTYQNEGYAGLPLDDQETMQVWNLIGLLGESGEIAGSFVKAFFNGHGDIDSAALRKELGDVEWYTAALCTKSNIELSEVMAQNIEKLKKRYPGGYTSADSKARVDTAECHQ
jgi:NTP pyrophosphatase (non-canonical NTP hydrolase)